ncbi:MAG: serine protease [Chloroflexi bacterium]|nr:serine protease [Chloroflexota bacterium]
MAFIQTSSASGSGVLLSDGYVITNAHVVWPYNSARIVFSDGSEFLNIPVLNQDLIADIAVLGPIDTDLNHIDLSNGENLIIGSDTYLIGYPGEVEEFPKPTVTRGLISRLREWDTGQITYFQTDATIAGGQSGGVLVSDKAEVIGISGFSFTEAGFGLVASSADLLPRVNALINEENVDNLGERTILMSGGARRTDLTLENFWDTKAFVIMEPVGTEIELSVSSDNDAALTLYDSFGTEILKVDDGFDGMESGAAIIDYAEPYFLVIKQFNEAVGQFRVHSNRNIVQLEDLDDSQRLNIGQITYGNIDYPGDIDYFILKLEGRDTVDIKVESAMVDSYITVDFEGAVEHEYTSDDDSGGGLFGLNALITFTAPRTKDYFVVVQDANSRAPGGYIVSVTPR